ncbi:MAG TPA: methyltransferase domain-containing protein [Longimicrobiales bacterium]|nr:methyltransferase domain-containing protein [Longimicrobiales bacterium]
MSIEQYQGRLPATWLWFTDCRHGGVALDASATTGQVAAELAPWFGEVHVLREREADFAGVRALAAALHDAPYREAVGTIHSAPFPEGSFDCVAVHDVLAGRSPASEDTARTLARIRALLRPGGWLAAASPRRGLRRSGARGVSPRAFTRALERAGFRDTRCLFAAPSIDRPLSLVPDSAPTVRAYEGSDPIAGTTSPGRRVLSWLGAGALLYPGYFILARTPAART